MGESHPWVHFSVTGDEKYHAFGDPHGPVPDFSKLQFPITLEITDVKDESIELVITQDMMTAAIEAADKTMQ